MILLQSPHAHFTPLQGLDRLQRGISATERGHDGNAALHGGGADFHFVFARVLAAGGVDDEGPFDSAHDWHVFVLHQVDDVGALAAGEFGEDCQAVALDLL